jgi:thiol-disulfide isomerase/thioredoxin
MHKYLIALILLLLVAAMPARAGFSLESSAGDSLEVRVWGKDNRGPLFVWLLNQYAETPRADQLAQALEAAGATVWRVDLLESLMLERTAEAIRNMDGDAVASLLEAAVKAVGSDASKQRPVVLVACDRMNVPLLKGLREWQLRAKPADRGRVAGGVLFFPNLYRGTPVAGEEPEMMDIVAASNMPLLVMQPELGANRERLSRLLGKFHAAGSPAYAWLVPQVRDYYLMHTEKPHSESLQAMAGKVPDAVERAVRETPERLLSAARLLAASRKPAKAAAMRAEPRSATAPAYGLIERPPMPAPPFSLVDALGVRQTLSPGRVTLVNFWATWCPPCVHEIPSMNRLAGAYDASRFGIVSINFKEDAPHVLAFLKRVEVDFPVLLDVDGTVSSRWKVFAFPSSFLLDRHGRVRYSVNTAIEWDDPAVKAVIDRLLREDAAP